MQKKNFSLHTLFALLQTEKEINLTLHWMMRSGIYINHGVVYVWFIALFQFQFQHSDLWGWLRFQPAFLSSETYSPAGAYSEERAKGGCTPPPCIQIFRKIEKLREDKRKIGYRKKY